MKSSTPNFSIASGPIGIRLVNDYLFRALLQQNNHVLKSLIASLLHLPIDQIESVAIQNEIILGEFIESKNFVLDIHVLLNNHTSINLEMQVVNHHNWVERSISYLCREFDSLEQGQDYFHVAPAIHIGILDYTLFSDAPEFYATYYLANEKTHRIYSDKLRLSVLDLTCIHLATEEDRQYGIDHWAALFKAETWEDLKMLAQNDQIMEEAASTIFNITQDRALREQCRAREEAIALEKYEQSVRTALEAQVEEQCTTIKEQRTKIAQNAATIAEQGATIAEQGATIAEQGATIAEQKALIEALQAQLAAQTADSATK